MTKREQFLAFLNERIKMASSDQSLAAYHIVKNAFDQMYSEQREHRLKQSLTIIAEWKLPETNQFWDADRKLPMSYGACYGSNGERDYMKRIAQLAIDNHL